MFKLNPIALAVSVTCDDTELIELSISNGPRAPICSLVTFFLALKSLNKLNHSLRNLYSS
ncbi:hypothetical protein [Clostridium acetobutylicum]|uniref:hypothetical protein n=1 Tax=Clostridium acetobutylicum TaxID=1488 RepID=UPI001852015A|nr:hypothetical protein [Clostridium acetobutylicum]NYC94151.1 hypothetical protein [Clostridium acetobutylicum]